MALIASLVVACGSAPTPAPAEVTPVPTASTPVSFIFVPTDDTIAPTVTPGPGMALDYSTLLMAHPGEKTKPYDGVTLMFHQAAPQNKMLLINMVGLQRLLDFLNQETKTQLVFILAPDDKEVQSPYDPESDMLVVQVHASSPPAQLTGSLVAAILMRDRSADPTITTAKAYAIYEAMRCVPVETYEVMPLPDGTLHVSNDDYELMLPALCGIEGLIVYTDAISPQPTPRPVVPDSSNSGA